MKTYAMRFMQFCAFICFYNNSNSKKKNALPCADVQLTIPCHQTCREGGVILFVLNFFWVWFGLENNIYTARYILLLHSKQVINNKYVLSEFSGCSIDKPRARGMFH